jgi:hypothetical protein
MLELGKFLCLKCSHIVAMLLVGKIKGVIMSSDGGGATILVDALRVFDSRHPQRVRMEGSQSTSLDNLSSTVAALRSFNAESDVIFAQTTDSFSQHIHLLGKIRQELLLLESRVTRAKERAINVAEFDGVDLSFLDAPKEL